MSAYPYGSAAPFAPPYAGGSSLPFNSYNSVYPAVYPSSYNQGNEAYQTVALNAPQLSDSTALPKVFPGDVEAHNGDNVEIREKTPLEVHLEKVKELESFLLAAVNESQLREHANAVKHQAESLNLFQQQAQVYVAQAQKINQAFRHIPDIYIDERQYRGKKIPKFELGGKAPAPQYPPIGSSLPIVNDQQGTASQVRAKDHPMVKLQEVLDFSSALRKHLDMSLQQEKTLNKVI